MKSINLLLFSWIGFFICIVNPPTFSQSSLHTNSLNKLKKYGDSAYHLHHYRRALSYYKQHAKGTDDLTPAQQYKLAHCYLKTRVNKQKAYHLLSPLSSKETGDSHYYFTLAKAAHLNYKLDTALHFYNLFIQQSGIAAKKRRQAERAISNCKNAKEIMRDTLPVTPQNLGPTINTEYDEYNPVIATNQQTLLFTTRRPGSEGGLQIKPGQRDTLLGTYYEDIWRSSRKNDSIWSPPHPLDTSINTPNHDAVRALSPSGSKLFMQRGDTIKTQHILYSERSKKQWSPPQRVISPINSYAQEQNISITPGGRTIYFSSNRPGGYGGADIYKCSKKANGEWEAPENLGGTINTPHDDIAPFIHPDGQTLYFSSKGHHNMGGFDLFLTRQRDTSWTTPENLGYPINTTDHDRFITITGNGQQAYLASARSGSYGGVDIYHLTLPPDLRPYPLQIVKGQVTARDSTVPSALQLKLNLLDKKTNKDIKEKIKITLNADGQYNLFLPYQARYELEVNASNYITFRDTFSTLEGSQTTKEDIYLSASDTVNTKVVRKKSKRPAPPSSDKIAKVEKEKEESNRIYMVTHFHFNSASLTPREQQQLKEVADILKNNKQITIEIAGHTDAIGSKKYNLELGKKRANSVYQYLREEQISATRISSKWYGELAPFAPNYLPHGVDNPTGRQLNRLTVIKLKGDSAKISQLPPPHLSDVYTLQQQTQKDFTTDSLFFGVQIAAYLDTLPAQYDSVFYEVHSFETQTRNLRRYVVGKYPNYQTADKCKQLIKKMGIEGAFVVSFLNGNRIPVKEALQYKPISP